MNLVMACFKAGATLSFIILASVLITNSAAAQSFEVPTGPFLDSSSYVPPAPLKNNPLLRTQGVIPITHYQQCGQIWSSNLYGSGMCSTICSQGCAMTDGAMLLKTNGVAADPGQLNSWLKNNGGYSGCGVLWSSIDHYPGSKMSWYGSAAYSLSILKSEIDAGNPVIVHVDHRYGGTGSCNHFVTVYDYTGAGTNASDFLVSDPGTSTFPTNWAYYSICSSGDAYPLRIYHNVFPQPCTTPTGIYSSSVTSNSAKVYCNAVTAASQYSIGIKTSNNSTYTFYTVSSLPIYLTNLIPGTTYNYKVAAYCSNGLTAYSPVYSFTTSSASSCPQPSGIYLSSLTGTSATLNWTSSSAISYNYFLKPSYQTSYWVYSNYNYKPITFSGLRPSTTYNFIVSSNCSGITSLQSPVYTFTTPAYRLSSEATSPGSKKNSPEGTYMLSVPDETIFHNDISLFPNPISSGQELSIEGIPENSNILIYTSDGKLIGSLRQISQFKFSLPDKLPASLYMIKIITANGNTVFKKLIVK